MRIGIAGIGLIGGSLALALRSTHDVVVFDTDSEARDLAARAGLRVADRLEALHPADAVIVATTLDAVVPTMAAIAPMAGGAVLMDTGSLKTPLAAFAHTAPPGVRIVGGHPMAGSTATGFAAADEELFRGRSFLLVPTARSDAFAMERAGEIARAAGAVPTVCSAETHDRVVAATSAGPLAAAIALALLGDESGGDALAPFVGPGFADATRLAATPDTLARALLAGDPHTDAAIRRLTELLEEVRAAAAGRGQDLDALLERARDARARAALGPASQRASSSSIP